MLLTLYILTTLYVATIILFLIGLSKKKPGTNRDRLTVTVIVAARNEEHTIGNILQDLTRQTYPVSLYRVIVVNDGSTDNTQQVIDSFTRRYDYITSSNIQDIPAGFSPKKYALQCAINSSTSEIILTTDADCRVHPTWIENMVTYFTPKTGFVIGFSQFGAKNEPQNCIERLQAFDFLQMMGVAAGTCNIGVPMAASGQNLGYRRDAFMQIGGFTRIAHRVSGDDVLLLQLVKKYTDYRIVFAADPRSRAFSAPQPDLVSFINQRIRWASNGSYQLFLNIPFFAYLLLYYVFSFFILFGLSCSFFTHHHQAFFLSGLLIKLLADFAITLKSALTFQRTDLLKYFPVWFIVQLPYIVYVGFLGTFGSFKWKERRHNAVVNKNRS
ncbi:MAG TPA: glycosyltransferase [bacterium]|nr:glycosyltransferase [bacterium]HPN45095.1 glycosyltransferase [bacterium]